MDEKDLPQNAPQDAIMASAEEIQATHHWATAAFTGQAPAPAPGAVGVRVVRQDFSTLHYGESCMGTPFKIGQKSFEHGLGTHANSEIALTLPAGAKAFKAAVGIDNNFDTQGTHGTAQFAVRQNGNELFRTPTCKGGDEPVPVEVALPEGTTALTLIVDTTADGAAYDQSDWADAQVVMADGRTLWLDANRTQSYFQAPQPPFSFIYNGVPSAKFLSSWKHEATVSEKDGRTVIEASWSDPQTGLTVLATATTFKDYPALDWVLHFENRGTQDTPIIEDIRTADMTMGTGSVQLPFVLHQIHGDNCSEETYLPLQSALNPGQSKTIAPTGGRPSQDTAFPFWTVQEGNHGVITAIGWSGQWSVAYDRDKAGLTRFRAGMEKTHLLLHPGEKIRTPRVLLLPWTGDRQAAQNRFRRLMMFEYVPQLNGKPLRLPLSLQDFDRYNFTVPEWATEAGQIQGVEAAKKIGFDTYWFDAGWFPGNFPNGSGNWFCKEKEFPNGLKPVGDVCDRLGLQFIVWFEPCRVSAGTQIATEHPDFVLGGGKDKKIEGIMNLYNLGNPEALRWITDLVSKRIDEFGIDVYREDYNIDPLTFWQANDTPDRQGMTEIRFVEGHYQFWDELRRRHPGLWIDNCASGGRRIDLETCMRAAPLWRSDTSCMPGHSEWMQQQSLALSQYLPLHCATTWTSGRYAVRSSATGGHLWEADYMNPKFDWEAAKASLDEVKADQKYWYGDFYPLTPANHTLDQFAAWQLHRADLNEGMLVAFRRPECPVIGMIAEPQGLDPQQTYAFEFVDEQGKSETRTMTGAAVQAEGLTLRIAEKGQSLLVRYRPAPAAK